MEIQDIPFNDGLTQIVLEDYGDTLDYVKHYMQPSNPKEIFFHNNQHSLLAVSDFLGDFNLNAKEGDICRIALKAYLNYPNPFGEESETFSVRVYYLWTGIITQRILRESSVRIGSAFIRTVLFEKKILMSNNVSTLKY